MEFLRISSGPILWAAHFTVIYAFTTLACARGFPAAIPWVLGAATLAALGVAAFIGARAWPRRARFASWFTAALAAAAAVAIVFEGLAFVMVPSCR